MDGAEEMEGEAVSGSVFEGAFWCGATLAWRSLKLTRENFGVLLFDGGGNSEEDSTPGWV